MEEDECLAEFRMRISKLLAHLICIDCSTSFNKKGAHDLQSTSEDSALQWQSLPEISEQTRENMKTVILALVVLLVVSQGEALTCWCGGIRSCSGRTETCSISEDVCASVSFHQFPRNNFHGCYSEDACRRLNHPGVVSCRYCKTDMCQ
ncbi:uncharacterized protein LOC144459473 [Epinephelus lanceolatus]